MNSKKTTKREKVTKIWAYLNENRVEYKDVSVRKKTGGVNFNPPVLLLIVVNTIFKTRYYNLFLLVVFDCIFNQLLV